MASAATAAVDALGGRVDVLEEKYATLMTRHEALMAKHEALLEAVLSPSDRPWGVLLLQTFCINLDTKIAALAARGAHAALGVACGPHARAPRAVALRAGRGQGPSGLFGARHLCKRCRL